MNPITTFINELKDDEYRKYAIDRALDKLLEKAVSASYATPFAAPAAKVPDEKPAPAKPATIKITHCWNDYGMVAGTRLRHKTDGYVFVVTDAFACSGGITLDETRLPNRYIDPVYLAGLKKVHSLSGYERFTTGIKDAAYRAAEWIVELPTGDIPLSHLKNRKRREDMRKAA